MMFIIIILQGCTYRTVTDYKNCVSKELIFEFKENLKIYIIDDSSGKHKYSSMNFPNGEHYLCVGEGDECIQSYKEKEDWNLIPLQSKSFHLTGNYKTNVPNTILGAFVPKTSALQAEIDGTKVWLSLHQFDNSNHKLSIKESIERLKENSELLNGWHLVFECPNTSVKEVDRTLIWFH